MHSFDFSFFFFPPDFISFSGRKDEKQEALKNPIVQVFSYCAF